MPGFGIGYNGSFYQNWGAGIRLQYDPTDNLKFDVGLRDEGQNEHYFNQLGAYGQGPPAGVNPFDVPGSYWTSDVLFPHVMQPRLSVSYQADRNNAFRFSYGRSAVFANAQSSGTPLHLYGLTPYLNIPANPAGPDCGAGPAVPGTGNVHWKVGTPGCTTYAQQLYWTADTNDYPDAGNTLPSIYNNYDLSFSHQFKNGYGVRLTGFRKIGADIPAAINLNAVLGIFSTENLGLNRTTGFELGITSPERPTGLSGFFSATYQNVLSSTPPLSQNETSVPQLTFATLALHDLYRAGYVSPLDLRIGAVDKLKNGWSISPQVTYNIGYPYSTGNSIASALFDNNGNIIGYANIPQSNFNGWTGTSGNSPIQGIGGLGGAAGSTNYYDPAFPGTVLHPNIAATRGTPATSSNGGYLSHANLQADLSIQYTKKNNTVGIQFFNLFGNAFINTVPAINTYYQPVATGVSGVQTPYTTCATQVPVGTVHNCYPTIPRDTYAFTNGAYLYTNGNFNAGPSLAPLIPFSFQVFYQRKL